VIDVTQEGAATTYINPNNGLPELLNDRPPLVLRTEIQPPSGSAFPITVIDNHLRSLTGVDDAVDGNRVRTKRAAQAEFLANLIQTRQVANPDERIISVGDYNVFQFNDGYVDVIGTARGFPAPANQVVKSSSDLVDPDLLDLVELAPAAQRYSYVFGGSA
jgi:predicted extracellular nuclease